jgi:hypothetical protein
MTHISTGVGLCPAGTILEKFFAFVVKREYLDCTQIFFSIEVMEVFFQGTTRALLHITGL